MNKPTAKDMWELLLQQSVRPAPGETAESFEADVYVLRRVFYAGMIAAMGTIRLGYKYLPREEAAGYFAALEREASDFIDNAEPPKRGESHA